MVDKFILEYARLIATHPDKIVVEQNNIDDLYNEIVIFASSADTGKLIGRDGKMIGAIKTLITGCKAKDGKSYKIEVKNIDAI